MRPAGGSVESLLLQPPHNPQKIKEAALDTAAIGHIILSSKPSNLERNSYLDIVESKSTDSEKIRQDSDGDNITDAFILYEEVQT